MSNNGNEDLMHPPEHQQTNDHATNTDDRMEQNSPIYFVIKKKFFYVNLIP